MPVMRLIGFFLVLLTAGCAWVDHPPEKTPEEKGVTTQAPKAGATGPDEAKPESSGAIQTKKPPAEPSGKKPAAVPGPQKKPASPALDLTGLETRLKETKAIGVFTKITLKNQVDDLLGQFRAYYQGRAKTSLSELRQPYDRLLLKVLSLLQDGDPELAREIVSSRETIWSILADPAKFATL